MALLQGESRETQRTDRRVDFPMNNERSRLKSGKIRLRSQHSSQCQTVSVGSRANLASKSLHTKGKTTLMIYCILKT